MIIKKFYKNSRRFLAWLVLMLCSLLVKVIPARFLYSFASFLGGLGYFILPRHRRIALESLDTAFSGEKSRKEQKQIARACFISIAKSAVELMFFLDRPEMLFQRFTISGKEILDEQLEKGNGVILVSAHFGNFPLMVVRLAMQGYKISALMRPMRDGRVERYFLKKRGRWNIGIIYSQPREICVDKTIETLRKNELIFVPVDQNFGSGGVFVNFFGHKAATAIGPVILARRTKAALLPCFIVRQEDNSHRIIIDRPIALSDDPAINERTLVDVQRMTRVIEEYIRRYPNEWGWIHRRWKSRPEPHKHRIIKEE